MNHNALILANGEPPTKKLLRQLRTHAALFVCADGGANAAARYNVAPDAIVGDMDSIQRQVLRKFHKVVFHKVVDDYSTDLEKTLAWVIERGSRDIAVVGATGGRLDHFIGNLSAMVKFSAKAAIRFIDDAGEWVFADRSINPNFPVGATVSLIPLTRCEGVVTTGLRWNLNFETLELGVREGTSNEVVENPVRVSVANGSLILFHLFKSTAARKMRRTGR
ncbi:MAG TPA: thiamine diphosphokinase [Bacteroidota bacterium]